MFVEEPCSALKITRWLKKTSSMMSNYLFNSNGVGIFQRTFTCSMLQFCNRSTIIVEVWSKLFEIYPTYWAMKEHHNRLCKLISSKFHFRQKILQNDVGRSWHFAHDKDVLKLTLEENPRMRIIEFVDKEFFVSILIKLLSIRFEIPSSILPLQKLLCEHKFRNC